MNRRTRTALGALAGGALLLAIGGALWLTLKPAADLSGRYGSQGQIRLSSGAVINATHSIQFSDGRFYAMSRQGDVLVETSGHIEHASDDRYLLRVDSGEVTRLRAEIDNALLFNLLYGRHKGAVIHLEPLHGCLYARETRQLYCAGGS
ncbi:hypothetical protein JQX08_00270 [Pseudomonas sp. UL073]|uniref:FecR protein domain-containing protein n=1 Tax=Zestomonas insulae TaxID=2809017 RepID=A0ABS2I7K8_9GAMM|nr:hypothetical protein [Pseudomonas insulae]MBM7059134.1 hypothetical protein [Pseudomonas insulae]